MDEGERLGGERKEDMYKSSPADLDLLVLPGEEVVVTDKLEDECKVIQ